MHAAVRESDSGPPLTALLPSWQLALEEAGKSPKTITSYTATVRALARYLSAHDMPDGTESADAPGIRAFIAAEIARTSAVSASIHYRNLRVWFGWLAREGERQAPNPMERVDKPKVAEKLKPFLSPGELAALLRACSGQDFESRRDTAIIRILIDCGVRVSGLAGLRYDPDTDELNDVFLTQRRLRVRLNGGEEWWVPVGRKSAAAIDRYIRARARHPHAHSRWLWLGQRGHDVRHMTDSGIRVMLSRRGEQAGVQGVTPHRFRHTFADQWLEGGGNVDDLMAVAGWKTYDMPLRYARGRGIARAAAAHARLSPGDRI
jgi:site-specific recombinase XerD